MVGMTTFHQRKLEFKNVENFAIGDKFWEWPKLVGAGKIDFLMIWLISLGIGSVLPTKMS